MLEQNFLSNLVLECFVDNIISEIFLHSISISTQQNDIPTSYYGDKFGDTVMPTLLLR